MADETQSNNGTKQRPLDMFREMNRYSEYDEDYRSSAVYTQPRRERFNDWRKYHATHDCGKEVVFVESTGDSLTSERYEYDLFCTACKYRVDEDDVLFIGGEWFEHEGWKHYGRPLSDLRLPPERVLSLGTDPNETEVIEALNITRIEREASFPHMMNWHDDDKLYEKFEACETCEFEVPILFDGNCRMCYNGPWTQRLSQALAALERTIRVHRNDSFVHRLENHIDPFHIGEPLVGSILWRKKEITENDKPIPKLCVMIDRYKNMDTGDGLYLVASPTRTKSLYLDRSEIEEWFWDTRLTCDNVDEPLQSDRLSELYQRVIKK